VALSRGFKYAPNAMADNDFQNDGASGVETERAIPITSRFLFVDVAAQRAKQLRRGALARLDRTVPSHGPHKLERVAMEEVRTGLIQYTLPTNYEGSPRGVVRE
jgi:DNA-directed RNA polymerase subunit K/omega